MHCVVAALEAERAGVLEPDEDELDENLLDDVEDGKEDENKVAVDDGVENEEEEDLDVDFEAALEG